jgi:hypothetical protein
MPKAVADLFLATNPIDSLFSVHGQCRHRDAAYGFSKLADESKGFLWCDTVSASGWRYNPVPGFLLAGRGCTGTSAWACHVEAILRPELCAQHRRDWAVGEGGQLLSGFRLEAGGALGASADDPVAPIQPCHDPVSFWYLFPAAERDPSLSFP